MFFFGVLVCLRREDEGVGREKGEGFRFFLDRREGGRFYDGSRRVLGVSRGIFPRFSGFLKFFFFSPVLKGWEVRRFRGPPPVVLTFWIVVVAFFLGEGRNL